MTLGTVSSDLVTRQKKARGQGDSCNQYHLLKCRNGLVSNSETVLTPSKWHVVNQLPSPKRFARPSLVSLGATDSYAGREVENASKFTRLRWQAIPRKQSSYDDETISLMTRTCEKCDHLNFPCFNWRSCFARFWLSPEAPTDPTHLYLPTDLSRLTSPSPAGFHNHRPEQRWHHQQGRSQGCAGHNGPTECEEWGAGGHGEGGKRPHQLHRLPDHVRREAEGYVDACPRTAQADFGLICYIILTLDAWYNSGLILDYHHCCSWD